MQLYNAIAPATNKNALTRLFAFQFQLYSTLIAGVLSNDFKLIE